MSTIKVAVTIEQNILEQVDRLVKKKIYPSRSRAIQNAVKEKIDRLNRRRLAEECKKIDAKYEQEFAEEGIEGVLEEWPEY
ncbi:CopG family transcriptional regulator [candidate division KSB1 bacterium]|nr:CopG family transcriptional regulator [candidate division KSB1 bacterium]MBL7093600.1 CopG family transcriptional regulator [candidate division KSB1 bacterium]